MLEFTMTSVRSPTGTTSGVLYDTTPGSASTFQRTAPVRASSASRYDEFS
jgi:hypothetical protein